MTAPTPATLLVATANVLRSLDAPVAGEVLDDVLARVPDLVALQEWGLRRYPLLRRRGPVRLLAPGFRTPPLGPGGPRDGYTWLAPLAGGCAVGARTERLRLLDARLRLLSGPGRADAGARPLLLRPPRLATVATYRDRATSVRITFVGYHLMPAVQVRGRYRADRPLLEGAHRQETLTLQRLVRERLALGDVVVAAGDSNFDGFRIEGLTSAWAGREGRRGTLGHRKVDDVHGPRPAVSVTLLPNASDHRAVLVRVPLR